MSLYSEVSRGDNKDGVFSSVCSHDGCWSIFSTGGNYAITNTSVHTTLWY